MLFPLIYTAVDLGYDAAGGPREVIRLLHLQISSESSQILDGPHCRRVSASNVTVEISSVWGVRAATLSIPMNSDCWLPGVLMGQAAACRVDGSWQGFECFQDGNLYIGWDGEQDFMRNPSWKVKCHRGDLVKKQWEHRGPGRML